MRKKLHGWILRRESKEQHLSVVVKGVKFVPEAISVWSGEWNISVLVNADVPFQVTTIYMSVCVIYVSMNLLIFMFINKKFTIHIFYKPTY